METGIVIRVLIVGKPETIDIGDPRLKTAQLLRWLAGLADDQLVVTMDRVREAIYFDPATPDAR